MYRSPKAQVEAPHFSIERTCQFDQHEPVPALGSPGGKEMNEGIEEFRLLSLEEMGATKVTFGSTHMGKAYSEVWPGKGMDPLVLQDVCGQQKDRAHEAVDVHRKHGGQPRGKAMAGPPPQMPAHEIPWT